MAKRILLIVALVLLATGLASAAGIYLVDDGSGENSVGIIGGGGTATMVWMNDFVAQPGMTVLDSIGIAYQWGGLPVGHPITLAIWSDPNNDGNPTDAILQRSAGAVTANVGSDTFNWTAITPLTVNPGDHFFVGAVYWEDVDAWPASLDETASQQRSWMGAWLTLDSVDINTLTGLYFTMNLVDNYGFPGNWMIRAEANGAGGVPEPVSAGLCALGLALAAGWKLRRR